MAAFDALTNTDVVRNSDVSNSCENRNLVISNFIYPRLLYDVVIVTLVVTGLASRVFPRSMT